jgi:ATP-binding cassette subfamily F protein uup
MAPPLLALRGASLRIGQRVLLDAVDVAVERGDRIGLVGRNGAGKSTLLRVLAGLAELDQGERFVQPRTSVAYLPQEPRFSGAATMLAELRRCLPSDADDGAALARCRAVLAHLELDGDRPVRDLSGGEARRLSIAQALVGDPDVLLLDEPTNHLDVTTIEWLEAELREARAALVLISHDRRFLANLTTRTWWLDRGVLRALDRGYAAFDAWAEQVLEAEEAERERLEQRIAAETHWLHRGVTARRKRNMGRLRQLQALREQRRGLIARAGNAALRAESTGRGGTMVIEAQGLTKAWGDRVVVRDLTIRIQRRDRIGIVGANGSGKTTLLGLLTGTIAPDAGTLRLGTELVIARFDQHRARLDPERTPWQTLCPDGGDQVEVLGRWRHVVGYLRDFLFDESQVRAPIRALSGGERNRLLLALILARRSNLLVLDEPTNDLDIETLDLLEDVLADYPGTVLLVSHDRDFLDRIVTATLAHEGDGCWREYAGGWSDLVAQRPPPAPAAAKPRPSPPRPAPAALVRRMDAKLLRELERLPARIEQAAAQVAALEGKLGDPDLYRRDPDGFTRLGAELEAARAALAALEARWLELELERESYPTS